MSKRLLIFSIIFIGFIAIAFSCSKKSGGSTVTPPTPPVPPVVGTNDMDFWLTKNDQSVLLQKQSVVLSFGTNSNSNSNIDIDTTQTFQTIDGFGYTLTGGSAFVINQLNATDKASLLKELFGNDNNSIGINYLRISIGASDLNASVFSYDDMLAGQTDTSLTNFSLNPDKTDLIPLLKEILLINPGVKILATPWSPPVWMKDNGNSIGGSLQTQYYDVYASYFVKYIQEMEANGIAIDAVTPQNEPLNPGNNPSLVMTAQEETNFIKNNLGPTFQSAGITTKIIAYDHNCDHPEYPLEILNDPAANAFVNGSAFHLYAGNISALSQVHTAYPDKAVYFTEPEYPLEILNDPAANAFVNGSAFHLYAGNISALSQVHTAYPDKAVYFTEQWTSSTGDFGGDLKWHLKNVIIGSMRNWSRVALEWNLANDPSYNPHTPGGCTQCKGALTLGTTVTRNVGYYIV